MSTPTDGMDGFDAHSAMAASSQGAGAADRDVKMEEFDSGLGLASGQQAAAASGDDHKWFASSNREDDGDESGAQEWIPWAPMVEAPVVHATQTADQRHVGRIQPDRGQLAVSEGADATTSFPATKRGDSLVAAAAKRPRPNPHVAYTSGPSLPHDLAFRLLTNEEEYCTGARPDFLNAQGEGSALGRIYKEQVKVSNDGKLVAQSKRPAASDFWRKNGKGTVYQLGRFYVDTDGRPCPCSADAAAMGVGDILLKRQYVTVQTKQMISPHEKLAKERWYHADEWSLSWTFEDSQVDRGDIPCEYRLYHVKREGRFDGASDSPPQGPQHVHGTLTLQLDETSENKTFINFVDAKGSTRGKIADTEYGTQLQTSAGDLAEWHKRQPTEPPFERGDIIGFGHDGLSRHTRGCKQLGIITAQAAVAGSTPADPSQVALGDYVAFTGIVAVKVRGPVRRNDFIVPSGLQDGTGKAASSEFVPPAYVGRANQDGFNVTRLGMFSRVEKAPAWQLIECTVVAPVHTVSGKQNSSRHYQVVAVLIMLSAAMLFAGFSLVGYNSRQNLQSDDGSPNSTQPGSEIARCPTQILQIPSDGFRRQLWQYMGSGWNHYKSTHTFLTFESIRAESTQSSKCPGPIFEGVVTQQCFSNGSWGAREGTCTRRRCKGGVKSFTAFAGSYNSTRKAFTPTALTVPDTKFGDIVQVPCCSTFSGTGSCVDNPQSTYSCGTVGAIVSSCRRASAGFVSFACGSTTPKASAPDHQLTASTYVFAQEYNTKMRTPKDLATKFYDRFVGYIAPVLRLQHLQTTWQLPKSGVLSAVSVGLSDEWRDVIATTQRSTDRAYASTSGSIDTVPDRRQDKSGWMHKRASGRAAAAFARTACRELGYQSSPFVTTCMGLQQLLRQVEGGHSTTRNSSNRSTLRLLNQLCPELEREWPGGDSTCSNWLEVREPNLNNKIHLDWLNASAAQNRQGAKFLSPPTDTADFPDWVTMNSSSWLLGPVPMSPSCDGTEKSVMQCFQHQVIIPVEQRRAWTRPCKHKMIVACSTESPSLAGTWVAGEWRQDVGADGPSAIDYPKIFSNTGGPLDCATGKPATDVDIATATARTLCWGTALGEGNVLLPLAA